VDTGFSAVLLDRHIANTGWLIYQALLIMDLPSKQTRGRLTLSRIDPERRSTKDCGQCRGLRLVISIRH